MIEIEGRVVNIEKYPDGTPKINIDVNEIEESDYCGKRCLIITWFYENNDELFYLLLVKRHLERHFTNVDYYLVMPYIPNARMDRTKNDSEVFTLKYFCDFINSLNFATVYVMDAHSSVSTALLNNCEEYEKPEKYIENAINDIGMNDLILYFPDLGAAKRYSELFPDLPYCYGEKKRDWKTGKILGLDIRDNGLDLTGKVVLMVDDIISYGGSLFYSAKALKSVGVGKIYAYATHTENSILDAEKGTLIKLLKDNTVERLFTTNSLFNMSHEKITVFDL